MSRKNYEAIARGLAKVRPVRDGCSEFRIWEECVNSISIVLADDNLKFNKSKFEEACYSW